MSEHNKDESQGKKNRLNRRSFVKTVGTSGVAVGALGSQVATAKQASDSDLKRALRSPGVRSILNELNDPEPGEAKYQVKQLGDSKSELELVTIPVKFGEIIYAEVNDQESTQFHFGSNLNRTLQNELPEKYQDLPSGSNPVLLEKEGDVVFRRSATNQEREIVGEIADIDDEAMVATGSDIDDFLITKSNESAQSFDLTFEEEFDSTSDELGTDVDINQKSATLTPRVRMQDKSCGLALGECLASGAGCVACSSTCAGAPTGVGAVACAACLQGVCVGIGGVKCAEAFGICLG
ncbi:twin-arginine translocation signal domain-containing protein (plasmid) [Haloferax larsenii]|uniref:Twin-arginine translocation signal domain-containing protein n=1 Tax=Haloferax larsenii TaxID=302484 RepID=A0ABY5RHY0_HALLR|nr:twin-arginine translocation signal domain-containing protein [Haloferax larsenii]UVE51991.1 twin-arginine translocation signal domain-containing protein [Haloferax larsenii]